jgi:acyl-CoA synthetase (AMP-forming)/AMP-acid ligase II
MSIATLLDLAAEMHPERPALGRAGETISFGELAIRVRIAAAFLSKSAPGSAVFIGKSGAAFHVALFAAARAGLPLTPVNYRLARGQIDELIDQLDRPVVIADPQCLPVPGSWRRTISTEELMLAAAPCGAVYRDHADESAPAVVLFTSGTTAKPKGVVLRHRHLLSYVLSTIDPGSATSAEAALVSVPPYHIAGVGAVLTNTAAGRRVVHLPDFAADAWLATVRTQGITSAMVVPTMLSRIVGHLDGHVADVPSLRALAYGGSRIGRVTVERALRAFPDTDFTNAYGLTETSSTVALLGPAEHRAALASDDPAVRARLGSVGRLLPGVAAEVRGPDRSPVPAGEVGELWLLGAQVSGEYLDGGATTDEQGWFPTRDMARLDKDGYLFIEGRIDDTIIRGGENIAPAEIEDVLMRHDAVRDAAVVGIPDVEWGERIVAVVVVEAGLEVTGSQLAAFVRRQLRSSRTPDAVVFRDELPRTDTGKVLRRSLVAEVSRVAP